MTDESLRYDTVSFLSDFGLEDEFVGVVHSVIRSLAPPVRVVDITHAVPPFDVRAGGLALARSTQYLAPGVVVAVVDPGVGTTRRAIAVEVGDGASVLVGPDNGVLAPAVAMCGGATDAIVLDRGDFHLPAPGATFDARDVFAPVAAHLCLGVPLSDLGSPIDAATLMPGTLPVPRDEPDGTVTAEVLWVDRFGNCQLNIDPELIESWDGRAVYEPDEGPRTMPLVESFAALPAGGIGMVLDSYGMVAVAGNRSSAADELDLAAGDELSLRPPGDDDEPAGVVTPVTISGPAEGAD
ncbi:MAG: S-adenosyl-l-methionine hydroxide adenosyltransferase family protein [Acidimicrobiales bacterium]